MLARIVASGAAFDRTAPVSDWGQGRRRSPAHLPARLLARASTWLSVDRVVSGASGARRGDRLEAATLAGAWGGRPLPPVLTPKAVVGEYGGGQLAASVAAVQGARFGRVSCFERPDAALGVAPHDGSELQAPRRVLVSSLGRRRGRGVDRLGAAVTARFAVAIPAFDAEGSIARVVRRALVLGTDVVVVDDGSRDGTGDAARASGVQVLTHAVNLGKGRALKTAFDHLFALGYDAVVTIDADGQHPPEETAEALDAVA